MAIYAISDLHLSFGENKPMDIFGINWKNHADKIKSDWLEKVNDNDTVILPGDFSWAMYLEDTYKDFEYLNQLPGNKILLKGNHDYWWTTIAKMRKFLLENDFRGIDFLYNNSFFIENNIIAGTRGWANQEDEDNAKIINRENIRLEMSIKDGINKYGKDKNIIVFTHFPPFSDSEILIDTMKKYNVSKCVFGHIHGKTVNEVFQGERERIEFKLVSCDSTKFKLIQI